MPTIFKLDKNFSSLIKVVSTVLITSALGLELWNLYSPVQGLTILFYIERFALISHGIEAAIASVYAAPRDQSPLKYSIYTFFVGTVALVELFQQPDTQEL